MDARQVRQQGAWALAHFSSEKRSGLADFSAQAYVPKISSKLRSNVRASDCNLVLTVTPTRGERAKTGRRGLYDRTGGNPLEAIPEGRALDVWSFK